MALRTVHPFPARMAPEVVAKVVERLPCDAILLDPMCGSGTVPRLGAVAGVRSIGADLDPLAAIISRCWSAPPAPHALLHDARRVLERATVLAQEGLEQPPWHDAETATYAEYWFAQRQRRDLSALAVAVSASPTMTRAALQTAMSRLVVTKDSGASLARDVSHSRPHRTRETNDFDVFVGFERAVKRIADYLISAPVRSPARIVQEDARYLKSVNSGSVDCIITSPPYLNAIDYMRGHRLSLIWLQYTVSETKGLRAACVGAERGLPGEDDMSDFLDESEGRASERLRAWVRRYACDANSAVAAIARVARASECQVVMIVGNSRIRGVRVDNAQVYRRSLEEHGFEVSAYERDIPTARRYLPISGGLSNRMRVESVLTAVR